MVIVRRACLIALLFAAPPLLTWATYLASKAMLAATHRAIEPQVLWYAAVVEVVIFFIVALLEVKDRW